VRLSVLGPEISISFNILSNSWLVKVLATGADVEQDVTFGYRHLTPFFFYTGIPALVLGGTDAC
jgi:hypothetical protein